MDSLLSQSVAFRLERLVVHRLQKPGQALLVGKILERQSLRRLAGVRIIRPEVSATEFDGVHAEPAGRRIDQSLGHRALDRVPDRAVLAHHVLVLEDDRRHRPIVVERIGAAHQVDDLVRLDTARARIHGIGADTAQGVDLEGKDGTVVPDRDLAGHPLVTRVNVGDEALHAVRDELDRSLEQHGEPDGRDLVGIGVHLDPERSSDVARDHPHPVLLQPIVRRENVLDHVRALGVVPHRQLLFGRIPLREDGARLDTDAGMSGEDEGLFDDVVGLRVRRLDVAEIHLSSPGEIVAETFVDHGRVGVECGLRIGDGRKHLPVDVHKPRPVFGQRAALGDDRDHRLALPGRGVQGQRVLGRGLQPDEVGEHADPGIVDLGKLPAGHHRDHPRRRPGRFGVDRSHPGVGVGRADERRVGGPVELDIVDEAASTLRQSRRVGAGDGATDVGIGPIQQPAIRNQVGHDTPPLRVRAISTASTIAS